MNVSMMNSFVALQNLQYNLDVIADNLANVHTTGYNRKNVTFLDVLTDRIDQPRDTIRGDRLTPPGLMRGWGAFVNQIELDMSQGSLTRTDVQTDLAIEGNALFEVLVPEIDGQGNWTTRSHWTGDGSFELRFLPNDPQNRYLTTKDGYLVSGIDDNPIAIPVGFAMKVDEYGRVFAYDEANPQAEPIGVGQLKLVRVLKPGLLENRGNNLYDLKPNADNANGEVLEILDMVRLTDPNMPAVKVRQGFLEQSNVDVSTEIVEAMAVSRSFQLNARALQSGDAMMNLTIRLRG